MWGAGGARASVRSVRGVMRARSRVFYAALYACAVWYAVFGTVAGRELRVLQADARATFYVGIAAPPSAVAVVHTFNRSLAEMSQNYFVEDYPLYLRNITLQSLYIELPEDER